MANEKVIEPIQALRGIAALMVVLWHASRYLAADGGGPIAQFFQPGATLGVDLFFLISGFIMVHTTRGSDGSRGYVAGFFAKRAARIGPLWAIALTVAVILQFDAGFLTDPIKRDWWLRSLLFMPTAGGISDVAPLYGAPVLGVGWTLNYEVYFYTIFGSALLFRRWRWLALAAIIVTTVLIVPWLTGGLVDLHGWLDLLACDRHYAYPIQYLNLATNPLVLLFSAGVAIGLLSHAQLPLPRHSGFWNALLACALGLVLLQFLTAFRTYHGVLQWGLSLIPLLLVTALASRRVALPVPGLLCRLGDVSFSLYLWHPLVLAAVFAMLRSLAPAGSDARALLMVVAIAATIGVATLSYRCIERGWSDALRRNALASINRLRAASDRRAVAVRTSD
jgi:exopolysaccharide production protein ExoZ